MKIVTISLLLFLTSCSSLFYKREPIVLNPNACEIGVSESVRFYNERCLTGQDSESAHYCDEMRKHIEELNKVERCESSYKIKMKKWIDREISENLIKPIK